MHNDGKMDGFAIGEYGPSFAYSQFDRPDVPSYFQWADEYVLCDNFFASVAGPSTRTTCMIAGQAGGAINNPENIKVRQLNDGRAFKSWGMRRIRRRRLRLRRGRAGQPRPAPACFDMKTVGHQLSKRDIDWAYYSADPYQAGYIWQAFSSIEDIFHDDELWQRHIWPVDDIMRDIEAEALPPVTWITPRFQLSDHPPFSTRHAHNWVTDIVNGLMRSSMWESIAIFITWDEWGGLYDQAGAADGRRRGARAPRADDGDLALRETRLHRRRVRGVLAAAVHRRQLGPALSHPAHRELAQLQARVRLRPQAAAALAWTPRASHERLLGLAGDVPGVAAVARPRGPEDPLPLIGRGCRALAAVVGQLVLQARQGVEHLRGEHGDEGRLVSHPGWQRILLPCSSPFVTVSRNAEISSRVVPFCSISARSMKMWVGCVNSTMRTSSPSASKCSWITPATLLGSIADAPLTAGSGVWPVGGEHHHPLALADVLVQQVDQVRQFGVLRLHRIAHLDGVHRVEVSDLVDQLVIDVEQVGHVVGAESFPLTTRRSASSATGCEPGSSTPPRRGPRRGRVRATCRRPPRPADRLRRSTR